MDGLPAACCITFWVASFCHAVPPLLDESNRPLHRPGASQQPPGYLPSSQQMVAADCGFDYLDKMVQNKCNYAGAPSAL
eukprot:1152494-Pelagomonas_calceolata.AAC.3